MFDGCSAFKDWRNSRHWSPTAAYYVDVMKAANATFDATDEEPASIAESSGILHFAAVARRLDILRQFTDPAGAFKYDPTQPDRVGGATALEVARSHGGDLKEWADKYGAFLGRYRIKKGPPVHGSATSRQVCCRLRRTLTSVLCRCCKEIASAC